MPHEMLIQEAVERARVQLESVLTLVELSFDAGENRAQLHGLDRIFDPAASALFAEARALLLCTAPRIELAMLALYMASAREPAAYGETQVEVGSLLRDGLQATIDEEFAAAQIACGTPESPLPLGT